MRIHGKFVGPNWSAGKRQSSVPYGRVRAVDEFDLSAKFHDHAYATGMDRKKADYLFYKWNVGKGFKRTAAALAVGLQGALRSSQKNNNNMYGRKRAASTQLGRAQNKFRKLSAPRSVAMPKKPAPTPRTKRRSVMANRGKKVPLRRGGYVKGFYKKKGPKVNRRLNNMEKYGTRSVAEFRTGISSTTTVYFGHCAVTRDNTYWTIARAIFKLLALRNGMPVNDFDASIAGSGVAGDQWSIQYLNGLDSTDAVQTYTFATLGVYSLETIAIKFKEHLQAITAAPNLTLINAAFLAVSNAWSRASISLKEAVLHIDSRSHMKFQNRTVSSSASKSTDVVDTNPLYGRVYYGYGTGTIHNVDTAQGQAQFIGDKTTGIMTYDGTLVTTLKEPPPPKQLTNIGYSKSAKMAPGEIQVSELKFIRAIALNKIISALKRQSSNPGADSNFLLTLGSFRLFALEKVMYDTSEEDIDVIFEVQNTLSSYISNVYAPLTAQIVSNI